MSVLEGFYGKVGSLTPLIDDFGYPMYNKWLWYRIPLFDYRYNSTDELIFRDDINILYEMDHHFQTDGGSIPPLVRMFPGIHLDPFNFPRAYLYHDCAFQYGGLYIKYPGETVFRFRLMTRKQANALLEALLPWDGATKYDVITISRCVDVGSVFIWDNIKKPALQREQRKINQINVYDQSGTLIEDNGGL